MAGSPPSSAVYPLLDRVHVSVTVPRAIYLRIRRVAAQQKQPMTEVVRQLIIEHLPEPDPAEARAAS